MSDYLNISMSLHGVEELVFIVLLANVIAGAWNKRSDIRFSLLVVPSNVAMKYLRALHEFQTRKWQKGTPGVES